MFDKKEKKEPQVINLCVGQVTFASDYGVMYCGKINDEKCVFKASSTLYVPVNGIFFTGKTKFTVLGASDTDVTLSWERT